MKLRSLAIRAGGLAALAAAASLAGCICHKCTQLNDPSCKDEQQLTTTVFLFGYNVTETGVLMHRVRQNDGLIAVKYDPSAGRLNLVDGCSVTGSYNYEGGERNDLKKELHSEDEAKAELPLSYVSFSGGFKQSQTLVIRYKQPGTWWGSKGNLTLDGPNCSSVTHVITGIAVGAYETHIGSESGAVLGASVASVGSTSGSSNESSDQQVSSGVFESCDGDGPTYPADGCQEPIMLYLSKVGDMGQNTESCNDQRYMTTGNGYTHNTTNHTFSITSTELSNVNGAEIQSNFTCQNTLLPEEDGALDIVVSFLQEHPGVKAHVSVAASLSFGGCFPDQHASAVQRKFSALVAERRVSIDNCTPPLQPPLMLPSVSDGVYVELTEGCVEGTAQQVCGGH